MLNKVVIVSDGTKTLVHINGKTYGDNIVKVSFEHDDSERRNTAEIRLTADTMPVETMDENYFEEFLHKVMTSEIPKLDELTVIKNAVSDVLAKYPKAETEQYGEGNGMDVLVKPIVDWLKTQDPYLEIHISSEYIKVVRINESIPVSETVSPQNQPSQTRY